MGSIGVKPATFAGYILKDPHSRGLVGRNQIPRFFKSMFGFLFAEHDACDEDYKLMSLREKNDVLKT